ncbi:MAG: acyl-CoA dehydrogenase [Alphaproteobacteria bacterium]|nr:acyl-CoA dehydrogenase [Alphaproteobacteria bacterium]
MDFSLSDEQRQMLDTVRRVTQATIRPSAQRWMDGTFPYPNMTALAEIGILGMAVPEEYGGMSATILDTVLVLEEIAKGCYVTSMAVLGEVGVQTRIIATFAPESIKRHWLPKIVSGDCILSICMTEPDVGTDLANMRTNAVVKNDRVILNGQKMLISRAAEAQLFVVFTRIDGRPGNKGIGCVLVEQGTPGLAHSAKYHTMGGENLAEVRFENVELPLDNLLLSEDSLRQLMSAFNTQRCLNPAICLGLAEASLEEAVVYLRERRAFGRPIGDFQGLRWKTVDMMTQIEAGRGLLYRAAASADPFPDPTLAAMAKIFVNEMSIKVCSDAVQCFGGYGFTDEFAVSRNYRGVRYGSLGGGTTETLRNLVGRKLIEHMDRATGVAGLGFY